MSKTPVIAKYRSYRFDKVVRLVTPIILDVEVLEENSDKYKIKICNTSDSIEGSIFWTEKDNIIFPEKIVKVL